MSNNVGVARFSLLKRENARLADLPRGGKIGLSDAERDDVLHRVRNIEKFSDSRRLDIENR
jgi:hypothetical protein